MKKLFFLSLLLSLTSCRLYEPPRYPRNQFPAASPQLRVLMIGDSLTYYNDLPGLLQQLSLAEPTPIYIEQVTSPYFSLKAHWTLGKAQQKIRGQHFDYVILQDFSRKPITSPTDSAKYFKLFADLAQSTGAKVILFQNWTRLKQDADLEPLQNFYATLAPQLHATLAPIGPAWRISQTQNPTLPLLLDDRHPTDAGTYLTACTLYDTLYQKKSANLPLTLHSPKLPTQTLQLLRQTADTTLISQQK